MALPTGAAAQNLPTESTGIPCLVLRQGTVRYL